MYKCTICGKTGQVISYKEGYICKECIQFIKLMVMDDFENIN